MNGQSLIFLKWQIKGRTATSIVSPRSPEVVMDWPKSSEDVCSRGGRRT